MPRTATLLLIVFVILAALALTWPGHALLASLMSTRVLGVPFAIAWNIGWVLAMLGVLTAYHLTVDGGD